ncbi:prepilin-type N-terminal cleavage/methylation domain-containing protein [Martelella alba]|uniref:Potassium:proton antiporter n=1 Tax=Martelella alba TaxID=2590451 RepID=A0ABY2SQ14_9HYPH|nr:prepilin-type N-terminal cleavage/methylation domain-containing protein [Martelella alba]TKI05929.1 potassium:proton antiporter [Martelella alba]
MLADGEQGFSLPEALAAVLLFSLSALALLDYSSHLAQAQENLRLYRQGQSYAHQALELYRLELPLARLELPDGWRLSLTAHARGPFCRLMRVRAASPAGQTIAAEEWFCVAPKGE